MKGKSFSQRIKYSLSRFDPNAAYLSKSQIFGTWIGIIMGLITFIFLGLLLANKLVQIYLQHNVYVSGFQLALKEDITINHQYDRFGLIVKLNINGQLIESSKYLSFGLNLTFCNVRFEQFQVKQCYQMIPSPGPQVFKIKTFQIPRDLKNFTIQKYWDWIIGVFRCNKTIDENCNESYQINSIKLQFQAYRNMYNLFQRDVSKSAGQMLKYGVYRNMSSQNCKYINIFYQSTQITTDYAVWPSFLPARQYQQNKTQVSPYQTIIAQEIPGENQCGSYLSPNLVAVKLSRSANNWVYYRNFKKIDTAFAQIFGLSAVVMLMWKLFFSHYNSWCRNKQYFRTIKQNLNNGNLNYNTEQESSKKNHIVEYLMRPFRNQAEKQRQQYLLKIMDSGTNQAEIVSNNAKLEQRLQQLEITCLKLSKQVTHLTQKIEKPYMKQLSNKSTQEFQSTQIYKRPQQIMYLLGQSVETMGKKASKSPLSEELLPFELQKNEKRDTS